MTPKFKNALTHLFFLLLILPLPIWIFLLLEIFGFGFHSIGWREAFMGGTYGVGAYQLAAPIYWIVLLICYLSYIKSYRKGEIITFGKSLWLLLVYPNIIYILATFYAVAIALDTFSK